MSLTTCSIAGLNLIAAPYTVEAFDLPDASVSELGRAAQLAGAIPCRAHYEEPPWALTIIVRSSVSADISNLHTKFRSGAALVFGEGATSLTTYLRSVEATTTANYSAWSRVTFSGLRSPEWEGAPVDLGTLTVTDGWGTVDAPTVDGEIAAKVLLYARSAAASTGLYIGVRPAPASTYVPLDDYSGVTDATAIGGAWSAQLAQTSTMTIIATAPARDIAGNRGPHLAVARLTNNTTTTSDQYYQVGSEVMTLTKSCPVIHPSAANTTTVEPLGTVAVPAFSAPYGEDSTAAYGPPAADIDQQLNNAQLLAGDSIYTFNVTADRLSTISFYSASATPSGFITLFTLGANNEATTYLSLYNVSLVQGWNTFTVNAPGHADFYLSFYPPMGSSTPAPILYQNANVSTRGKFTRLNGVSVPEPAGDLTFKTSTANLATASATMPVSAASGQAAKVANIDAAMRIPVDFSAITATTAIGAGAGILYDPDSRAVYPCNAAAQLSGVSLAAAADVLGTARGIALAPSVTNRFVVANGAKSTVTLTGTATPCYIRRR